MVKCLSCNATYEQLLPDGMLYFHRCAPLSAPQLDAAVKAGKIVLPIDPATTLPETPEVAVSRRTYEHTLLRDENIKGPAPSPSAPAPIKSAGAGIIDLGVAALPPVVKVP